MADISNISSRIGLPNHMKIFRIDAEKPHTEEDEFTVLVNPSSYKITYGTCHDNSQYLGAEESQYKFNRVKGQSMTIQLLFDSTGSLGKIPLNNEIPVLAEVDRFLEVTHGGKPDENGKLVEKKLKIIWGSLIFIGVLSKIGITYSHFDESGEPIRATASCTFSGGEVLFKQSEKAKKIKENKAKSKKIIDYNKEKHAINAVVKYSHYMAVVAQQPRTALPKSLRIAEEVAKLIIR